MDPLSMIPFMMKNNGPSDPKFDKWAPIIIVGFVVVVILFVVFSKGAKY